VFQDQSSTSKKTPHLFTTPTQMDGEWTLIKRKQPMPAETPRKKKTFARSRDRMLVPSPETEEAKYVESAMPALTFCPIDPPKPPPSPPPPPLAGFIEDALSVTPPTVDRVQEEAGHSYDGGAEEVDTVSEVAPTLPRPPVVDTTPLLIAAPTEEVVVEQVAVPMPAADDPPYQAQVGGEEGNESGDGGAPDAADDLQEPATWNDHLVTCDRCGNVWDGNAQCLCSLEWQSSEEEEA
jgi:hypothetical protein